MKDFIRKKLHENWGWDDEPTMTSPLSKEVQDIVNAKYDDYNAQKALRNLEEKYVSMYAEYEGDTYGVIDAIKKVLPRSLRIIYNEMHPTITNETISEANEDSFIKFVTEIGAKPVNGKIGMFAFVHGQSILYFKNSKKSNTIEADLIHTPVEARGSGSARKTFVEFLKFVDKYGFIVEGIIAARDAQTNETQLAKFYKSLGFRFKEMGGYASDFEIIRYKGGR